MGMMSVLIGTNRTLVRTVLDHVVQHVMDIIIVRCRACRTMVLGQTEGSAARSSFSLNASSAARTRSQCGPSEVLVTGRGRFFDAIMLLVSAGFSFTETG
jgi:hypothetical protein